MSTNRLFFSVFLVVVLLALTINQGAKAFPLDHHDTFRSVKRDAAVTSSTHKLKPVSNLSGASSKPTHEHVAQPSRNSTPPKTSELPNVQPGTNPAKYPTPSHQPSNSTNTPDDTPVVIPVKPTNESLNYSIPSKGSTNSTHQPDKKPTSCRKNPKSRLPQTIKPKPKIPKYSVPLKRESISDTFNYYK
ncbi:secreted protein [Melampsora americana]|nr:secreted protein [Melampsora americana]